MKVTEYRVYPGVTGYNYRVYRRETSDLEEAFAWVYAKGSAVVIQSPLKVTVLDKGDTWEYVISP